MNVDSWTSRKFALAIGVLLLATAFVAFGKADFNQWSNIVQWILVTYLGANVLETAVDKR